MLTVISFFTCDWRYPEFAKRLERDCDRLGIPHIIEELPSTGSYLKNTCMKPAFIKEKLIQQASPVLWIDCDGSLLAQPTFFESLYLFDMAAKRMPPTRTRTWHVGTLWMNYTKEALLFLDKWISNVGQISDESALEKTWREHRCIATDIPPEYFRILYGDDSPGPNDVICHRISNGVSKKLELPGAIKKGKAGIL